MKVLLVTLPPNSQNLGLGSFTLVEPLALELIAAGIRKNHDIKILDLRVDTESGLRETLESFQPDIIGCGPYTLEVNPTKKIFAEARKIRPGILTVVGGIHATMMPVDFFQEDVDVIVKGEGVGPFRKICDYHEKNKSFADIENIYYRNNGKMVFTREEPYPDLDTLPFPDRTLTAHLRGKYQTLLADKLIPWAAIRGSIGCYFRCKFCSVSAMTKQKIYARSPENIIRELEMIEEKFVFWVDDELFIDPERTTKLAAEIGKSGIKKRHICCGRSDTIVKHPEVVEQWAKIGMDYIFIGMEGFRDEDLKEMKKGMRLSTNDEAIRICHQAGVKVRASLIIMPGFDKKDFKKMADYVRKSRVDFPTFSVYTPLPGTELWKESETRMITRNYDYFDFVHPVLPTKLPIKQFYKEYLKLFDRSVPLSKKIKFLREVDPGLRRIYIRNYKLIKKIFKGFGKHYAPLDNSQNRN